MLRLVVMCIFPQCCSAADVFFALLIRTRRNAAMMHINPITPKAAPTPMAASAPVDKPDELVAPTSCPSALAAEVDKDVVLELLELPASGVVGPPLAKLVAADCELVLSNAVVCHAVRTAPLFPSSSSGDAAWNVSDVWIRAVDQAITTRSAACP